MSRTPTIHPWVSSRAGMRMIFWPSTVILIGIHLGCLTVFWTGTSPVAVGIAFLIFLARGFSMTAGFHRYFAHRSYKTGRVFQFLLGFIGTSATQNGPLWWSAHHRNHHRNSDTDQDPHSLRSKGFWWAHMGWIMDQRAYRRVDTTLIADLVKYPELRWLDRWCLVPPICIVVVLWALGNFLAGSQPELGTSGPQLVTWGFFIATVVGYHVTFSVNSLTHVFGSKRFDTGDESRNNTFVAIVALGEGWHNNHHAFPFAERQGLTWWEIDVTHYILKILSWFGVVWALQGVSAKQLAAVGGMTGPLHANMNGGQSKESKSEELIG